MNSGLRTTDEGEERNASADVRQNKIFFLGSRDRDYLEKSLAKLVAVRSLGTR